MIFAVFIGVLLGLRDVDTALAMVFLAGALGAKAIVDVKWERVPFFAVVSPYVVYRHNLMAAGEDTKHAWISYVLQLFLFGGLLGGTAYAIVTLIRS